MSDQLEIIGPSGDIRFHDLNPVKGFTNIGSHPDNDIVITSPDVAPFHAVIDHRQRPAHIINMGRGGAIRVGGQAVEPNASRVLNNWDTIELNGHTLVMMEGLAAGAGAIAAPIPYASTPSPAWEPTPAAPPVPAPMPVAPVEPLPVVTPPPLITAGVPTALLPGVNAPIPDQVSEQILVEISQREFTLDVDQSTTFDVTVINGGPIVATFELRIDGLDPTWVVAPASVNLFEGERSTLTVTLNVPRLPTSRAGTHYFGVNVTSPELSSQRAVIGCILNVNPYYEHTVTELSPRQQRLNWFRRAGQVTYTIANHGNSAAAYRLDASDDERAMQFEFKLDPQGASLAKQAELHLQPEQIKTVQVSFNSQKRIFFGFTNLLQSFTVTTTPLQGSPLPRSLLGQAETSPLIGPIHVFLVLLTLVILIALIFRPSIKQFTADPDTIISGEEVKMAWDVSSFADVKIDQGLGAQGRGSGSITILPLDNTTYRLTASTPLLSNLIPFWFTQTEERTVIVDPIFPIVRFNADKTTVLSGESATLTWEVLNAEEVVLISNGALETLPPEQYHTSRIVSPEGEGTYTIQARNRYTTGQPISRTVIINAIAPTPTPWPQPIIQRFDALPGNIVAGESVALEWTATNAEKVRIDPGGQEFSPTGRLVLKPDQTTTYILTAINGPNEVRSLREVVVVPPPTPTPVPGTPVIEFFTGTPLEVALGSEEASNIQLAWSITGDLTDIELTGDTVGKIAGLSPQGNLNVAAGEADTQYVLTAYNGELKASQTIIVKVVVPIPVISSLSPASTTQVGGSSLTITVSGSNFVNGAVVRWGDSDRSTSFVSSTQLTAVLTAADLAEAGTEKISVFNPATAGGGSSSPVTFYVNNPVPSVSSITPSEDIVRTTDLTLVVTGSNFVEASTVRWNSTDMETTYNSATQLTAVIPSDKVSAAGSATVTVFSPTPGGGSSGTQTFTVKNPLPTLTLVTPSSVMVGSDAVTLTIAGTGFVGGTNGTKISWDGDIRDATYSNSKQLTLVVPAEDLVTPGNVNISAVNLAPGGGVSSPALIFVIKRAPVTVTVASSPPSPVAGQGTTFLATIQPNSSTITNVPTGLVTFQTVIGANVITLGQASLSGNPATAALSSNYFDVVNSPYSVTAVYGGDTYFDERTSAPLVLTVGEADVQVTVNVSPNPAPLNSNVTLTAVVTATTPGSNNPVSPAGGSVQFFRNGTPIGAAAAINNSQAQLIVCGYGVGLGTGGCTVGAGAMTGGATNTITATYNGDSDPNFTSGSSTLPVVLDLTKMQPVVSLSSNTPTFGESSVFTATVTAPNGITAISPANGGLVTFKNGSTTIGTAFLTGAGGGSASATLTVPAFTFTAAASPYSITAAFTGSSDPYFTDSTSGTLSHSVNKASTTATVSASPASFNYGDNTTLTASVSGGTAGTPTSGSFNFYYDGVSVTCSSTSSYSSGSVNCITNRIPGGNHTITVAFVSSDGNFASSATSAGASVTVNKGSPSLSFVSVNYGGGPATPLAGLCTSTSIPIGMPDGSNTLNVLITGINGQDRPTGSVTFKYQTHYNDGSPNSFDSYDYNPSPSTSNTYSTATSYVSGASNNGFSWVDDGYSQVTATYNGDSNYNPISAICYAIGTYH